MVKKFSSILVLTLSAFALFIINAATVLPKEGKPIKGEVVVKTRAQGIPDAVLARFKGKVKNQIPGQKTLLIEFPDVIPFEIVINALERSKFVKYAEPNYEIEIVDVQQISISSPDQYAPPLLLRLSPPNYYGQLTNLNIGLESANALSSGEGITVAVIDNGLAFEHPLFQGRVNSSGYDFIQNDTDPSEEPGTMIGHGTFVSGLIALVAPNCKILPIRSFDGNGIGSSFSIAQGINHAVEQSVRVINMSFGMESYSKLLDSAVSFALSKGTIMIASSGNDGEGAVMYPAAYHGVIAVSALDSWDVIAEFSNYGSFIDISAPGVNLYSSLAGEYEWGWWSGTSFSASVVSGVAGLIISRRSGLSPLDVRLLLRNTSRTELNWGSISPPDIHYGHGVVDAYSSLIAVGRGDINNSGSVDITDLTKYINYIFRKGELGANPMITADFNCDGNVNLLDFSNVVNYIFRDGELLDPCY